MPLLAPDRIGTDGASTFSAAIRHGVEPGLLPADPVHYVTKHLQQRIESDHFRLNRPMPRGGWLRSFHTAGRTIAGLEAMLWLRKAFAFAVAWTVRRENELIALHCGLQKVNET
jgi:transposase, IS6 family